MPVMPRTMLRLLLALSCAAPGACGFQPRGAAPLPFDTVYIQAPQTSVFATQLKRALSTGGQARVLEDQKAAQVTLQVLRELREKSILSLSVGGRVREFELRYRVSYRLYDKDMKEISAPSEITLRRDLSYNDEDVLAKEAEESLLYRDMQNDAVHQLLRRLQATKIAAR